MLFLQIVQLLFNNNSDIKANMKKMVSFVEGSALAHGHTENARLQSACLTSS